MGVFFLAQAHIMVDSVSHCMECLYFNVTGKEIALYFSLVWTVNDLCLYVAAY